MMAALKALGFEEGADYTIGSETYDLITFNFYLCFAQPVPKDRLRRLMQVLDDVLGEDNFLGRVLTPSEILIEYYVWKLMAENEGN